MPSREDNRFVFVAGLQRSGTTLVGRILASHPDASGLVNTTTAEDEGQFLQSVYLDDHAMGIRGRSRRGKVMKWAYHPEAHLTEGDALLRRDARTRLEDSWRPYWQRPSAQVLVEKSPSNLTRTRFLQAVFPGSRFIVITRHPVVQALAIRKWSTTTHRFGFRFHDFLDHWLTAMDTYTADQPYLADAVTVPYERLIANPASVVRELYDFAGLADVEPDLGTEGARSDRYVRYWNWVTKGVGEYATLDPPASAAGRARAQAERYAARGAWLVGGKKLIREYEPRIRRYGYSFDDITSWNG